MTLESYRSKDSFGFGLGIGLGIGFGIGVSLLLHVLVIIAAIAFLSKSGIPEPRQYTVRLVGPSPMEHEVPKVRGPMPDRPEAITVPNPSAGPSTVKPESGSDAPGITLNPPVALNSAGPGAHDTPVLGPSAFYDKEEIAKVALKDAEESLKAEDGVTFETSDIMRRGYMDMLRTKVESIWKYPAEAARQGIYGDLIILFVIRKDGTLGEVRVLRTSGHRMLDEAAVKALRDGVPYWPLPEGWDQEALTIRGRFIYTKGSYYLR